MGWVRRHSLPHAWVLLVLGICILAAVGVDVAYVRTQPATAVNAQYPLPEIYGALRLQHNGTQTLSRAAAAVGGPCKGLGAYGDLLGGTPVVVKNEAGAVIATGSLDIGKVSDGSTCEFAVYVPGVPEAASYRFEVGNRSVLIASHDELVARGWQVALSLG